MAQNSKVAVDELFVSPLAKQKVKTSSTLVVIYNSRVAPTKGLSAK